MSTTSHYEVFAKLPTLTEEKAEEVMNPQHYELPEATSETIGGVKQAENVEESSATTVAGLKETVNAILDSLKAAGVMEPDEESET